MRHYHLSSLRILGFIPQRYAPFSTGSFHSLPAARVRKLWACLASLCFPRCIVTKCSLTSFPSGEWSKTRFPGSVQEREFFLLTFIPHCFSSFTGEHIDNLSDFFPHSFADVKMSSNVAWALQNEELTPCQILWIFVQTSHLDRISRGDEWSFRGCRRRSAGWHFVGELVHHLLYFALSVWICATSWLL